MLRVTHIFQERLQFIANSPFVACGIEEQLVGFITELKVFDLCTCVFKTVMVLILIERVKGTDEDHVGRSEQNVILVLKQLIAINTSTVIADTLWKIRLIAGLHFNVVNSLSIIQVYIQTNAVSSNVSLNRFLRLRCKLRAISVLYVSNSHIRHQALDDFSTYLWIVAHYVTKHEVVCELNVFIVDTGVDFFSHLPHLQRSTLLHHYYNT